MKKIFTAFDNKEQAWASDEVSLDRNVYLTISLTKAGKVVIRQNCGDGKWYRMPIKKHNDTKEFCVRLQIPISGFKIKIFTSTQPKDISYAYI